jgi:hypothetical protein
MPVSSTERRRQWLAHQCAPLLAFLAAHRAGRMTGKRRATLRRLRKALDPPGLGTDSFRHILRFFGLDEQREAVKLAARVVDAHDHRTQGEAARREARRTARAMALTAYLRGGGNGRRGGRKRTVAGATSEEVVVPESVREVRRVAASATRALKQGSRATATTLATWQRFTRQQRPDEVNKALWRTAQVVVAKALKRAAA